MKVTVTPQAERDFGAQVRWLHEHSPRAGRKASEQIVRALDLLADFPELGIEVGTGLREKHVRFGRDGFVIRYRIGVLTVTVLRIFHGSQDR